MRDVQERFTTSELVVLAWRSQEQSYKMRQRIHRPTDSESDESYTFDAAAKPSSKKSKKEYADADVPEGLPDRFYDEEGGVNLSKTTLKDAVKYMNSIGISMPMPLPGKNTYSGRLVSKEDSQDSVPTMDDLF